MSKAPKLTAADAKRLAPRKHISLAGGETAPNPARGLDRRHTNQPQEDARIVALQARAKVYGGVDPADVQRAFLETFTSTPIGMCVVRLHPDKIAELRDVWYAASAARATYRTRVFGTTGQPKGASIAFIPDKLETDPSAYVDLRTAEERDIAAKRGDAYWASLIAALPTPNHKEALRPAMDEVEGALWRDCKPTARGRVAVAALVLLKGMHGK